LWLSGGSRARNKGQVHYITTSTFSTHFNMFFVPSDEIVQLKSSFNINHPVVSFSKKLYPHCLVLVVSSNISLPFS